MSNVVSMDQPCAYYIARASKHRLSGRFDQAMALLSRAKDQFGLREDIELEMARVYEEIDCDEEAVRSYLRIVRLNGVHKDWALFQLALHSIERGELNRASSYYQSCRTAGGVPEISGDAISMLEAQLIELEKPKRVFSRKSRAKALEQRAVEKMHAGKAAAALRAIKRSVRIRPTYRGYTLLACCFLLHGQAGAAVAAANHALALKPGRIQTQCVLVDALQAAGARHEARNRLYRASFRVKDVDDAFLIAIECAKYGEDRLTLRMTEYILKRSVFHVRAMVLRGCALINLGRMNEASRIFARVCGLLPENTVCEAYYRMAQEGRMPEQRLDLGIDVDCRELFRRIAELMKVFVAFQNDQWPDETVERKVCRICAWAIESAMVGAHAKTAAVMLLASIGSDDAREVLEDCLMDAHMDDCFKLSVLRILTEKADFKPYWVDLGGKLVRLEPEDIRSELL